MFGVGFKEYNSIGVNALSIIFGITYIIYNSIKNKEYKIIKNKIDVFVIIFLCICPVLPLIFNTYKSLEGTVIYSFRYISTLSLYIVARDVSKDKFNVKLIVITFIISGVMLGIFGIANMEQWQIYKWLEAKLKWPVVSDEGAMISSMGYKNSFAIYMGAILVLITYEFKETKKVLIKIIYGLIGTFIFYCVLSAHSLVAMAEIMLMELIYIFITSNHKKIIKNIIIISSASIAIFAILILVVINSGAKGTFRYTGEQTQYYNINNIVKNSEYEFKIQLTNHSEDDYNIYIRKLNRHNELEEGINIEIKGKFSGEVSKKIKTDSNTEYLEIYFGNDYETDQKIDIEINSVQVNEKEFILKYKYIPEKISRKINNLVYKDESTNARIMMIKAGVKLGKDSWLIGCGGNAWEDSSFYVEDWKSNAKIIHSYIAEIFVEFGTIGIITFCAITVSMFCTIKKYPNNTNKAIIIAILVILIHSIIDFDMTFLNIFTNIFVMLAVLFSKSDDERQNNIKKILEVIVIICFGVTLLIETIHCIYNNNKKSDVSKILTYIYQIDEKELNSLIISKKYNDAIDKLEEIANKEKNKDLYEKYKWIDYSNVDESHLEKVLCYVENHPFNIDYKHNKDRVDLICLILKSNKSKTTDKFADILISENEEMKDRIINTDANKMSTKEIQEKLKKQEKAVEQAIEYRNK